MSPCYFNSFVVVGKQENELTLRPHSQTLFFGLPTRATQSRIPGAGYPLTLPLD
jgi:hypothetical protein